MKTIGWEEMIEKRKQMVSLRVAANDLAKVRGIAQRLRVRESDVFRFAIKVTLARLGALHDEMVAGADLLPVFIDIGAELAGYFELDGAMLERIINEHASDGRRIERRDIELMMAAGGRNSQGLLRLKELLAGRDDANVIPQLLNEYMYEKYMRNETGGREVAGESGVRNLLEG